MNFIVAALLALTSLQPVAGDVCESDLPEPLKAQIKAAYPSFRLPGVTDNLPEDVAFNIEEGGSGCLGVATADFDRNNGQDFVIALREVKGAGAIVVVALSRGQTWQLRRLARWPSGRSRLYVGKGDPGTYYRFSGLDGPMESGELGQFKCSTPVVVLGATEASALAYCYKGGEWPYVLVSD